MVSTPTMADEGRERGESAGVGPSSTGDFDPSAAAVHDMIADAQMAAMDRGLGGGRSPGSFGGWDVGLRGLQTLASLALGILGVPGSVMAPVGGLLRGGAAALQGKSPQDIEN